MSYLFKHSVVGSLIRYGIKGNFDFSRHQESSILSEGPSTDDIGTPENKDTRIIDWNGPDDPSNPLNWPLWQRLVVTFLLCLNTWAVYVGSSIYTPGQQQVIEFFGISHVEGTLGIALYVLGYGLGCLLFSPLSEIPAIGRNPPYAVSGLLFLILCIPTALVDNFAGLAVLRFLLGFMASPCLATTAASFSDIWRVPQMPFVIAVWAYFAGFGPALGPSIAGDAVERLGWRFSSWELLIISGPIYVLLMCFVPETSPHTILYHRGKRLREETGVEESTAEADKSQIALGSLLWDALIKPWEMNALDPALLFTTVYTGLCYGIYYSFFESLPLVFPIFYDFSISSTGLVFLGVIPAQGIGICLYFIYMKYRIQPGLENGTFGELENYLIPGLIGSPSVPLGLFLYAWTSHPSIHWICPAIGLGITMFGIFLISQSMFIYIPNIYPRYAASIFAANSLSRSLFAFVAILVARPMFESLGINGGISLLAGLTVLCMLLLAGLWKWGKTLRERSRFAVN